MKTVMVVLMFVFCFGLTVFAFPENRPKRNPEKVVVEVIPVVVYEVPPIPSVLAFDFEEARKGKGVKVETPKKHEEKKEKKSKSVSKRDEEDVKREDKEEFKEDLKEEAKINMKKNGMKIEEKLEDKVEGKAEEKFEEKFKF